MAVVYQGQPLGLTLKEVAENFGVSMRVKYFIVKDFDSSDMKIRSPLEGHLKGSVVRCDMHVDKGEWYLFVYFPDYPDGEYEDEMRIYRLKDLVLYEGIIRT